MSETALGSGDPTAGEVQLTFLDEFRTLAPSLDLEPATLRLNFASAQHPGVETTVAAGLSRTVRLGAGSWTLTATAYNGAVLPRPIAQGQASFEIRGGLRTPVRLGLGPLTGPGTLTLNADLSSLNLNQPQVTAEIKNELMQTVHTLPFTLNGAQASLNAAPLEAGSYHLFVRVKDGSTAYASAYSALSMRSGEATLGSLVVTAASEGPALLSLVTYQELAPSVSLSGLPASVTEGQSFTLTAVSSAADPSFQWKLNGVTVPGASSATWQVPATLTPGAYTVAVIATKGTLAGSASVEFTVQPLVVPPIEIRLYFKAAAAPTLWLWEDGAGGRALSELMGQTWDTQSTLSADPSYPGWYFISLPANLGPYPKTLKMILNKGTTELTKTGGATNFHFWFENQWHDSFPEAPAKPSIQVSPAGGSFASVPISVTVLLHSVDPITQKEYRIDGGPWQPLGSSPLNLGAALADGASSSLEVRAVNAQGTTQAGPFVYTKSAAVATADPRSLRIYQVMVEAYQDGDPAVNFNAGFGPSNHRGDLKGIRFALDYMKSLGVNALWMTPVFHSMSGELNGQATGYFADNFFAVDPRFGTEQDLRDLIDAAHARGMYVFLDGVFGHHGANIQASPSGKKPVALKDQWYGKQVDYNHPDTLAFFKEVATYWVRHYGIDGWRLDQAYQVPIWAWKEIREAVEAESLARKNAGQTWGTLGYMVGEIWDGNPANIAQDGYGTAQNPGLLSNFDFPVRYALTQVLATQEHKNQPGASNQPASKLNETMNAIAAAYPAHAVPNLMLTNHDLVNFGDLIQRAPHLGYGPENPDYWKRHKLALSFLGAFTGAITLYYGDEYGHQVANFVNQGDRGFWDDHVSRDNGRINGFSSAESDLIAYTSSLMQLRQTYPALWRGARTNLLADPTRYADLKTDGTQKIVYVMNTGTSDTTVSLSGLGGSGLKDLQSQQLISGSGSYSIPVPALSARFLLVQ